MRETRDLLIQWAQWHTLLFEGQVDIRVAFSQDVKEMLFKTSQDGLMEEMGGKSSGAERRSTGKEGQPCVDNHRNVVRRLVV